MLYLKRQTQVQVLDNTPDPLFNPHEVTRVKDILDLHARGIAPPLAGRLRGEIVDERSDYAKMQSANYESDKLYPSLPKVVLQNAHYSSLLGDDKRELEQDIDFQNEVLKSINDVPRGTNQLTDPKPVGSESVESK